MRLRIAALLVALAVGPSSRMPAADGVREVFQHENVLGPSFELKVAVASPAEANRAEALALAEIDRLAALQGAEINEAKKVLATEATALVHGRAKADAAAETARKTFEQGALASDLPTVTLPRAELDAGLGVLAAFVKAGLVKSNGEARRQIQGGGLRINDAAVTDEKASVGTGALTGDGVIKLSLGKKRHVLLKPV